MLSICQLHLQLPFDDCPTVAAADVDMCVCVCVCVQLLSVN